MAEELMIKTMPMPSLPEVLITSYAASAFALTREGNEVRITLAHSAFPGDSSSGAGSNGAAVGSTTSVDGTKSESKPPCASYWKELSDALGLAHVSHRSVLLAAPQVFDSMLEIIQLRALISLVIHHLILRVCCHKQLLAHCMATERAATRLSDKGQARDNSSMAATPYCEQSPWQR